MTLTATINLNYDKDRAFLRYILAYFQDQKEDKPKPDVHLGHGLGQAQSPTGFNDTHSVDPTGSDEMAVPKTTDVTSAMAQTDEGRKLTQSESPPSMDQLRKALGPKLVKAEHRDAIRSYLDNYQANTVDSLKLEQRPHFLNFINTLK